MSIDRDRVWLALIIAAMLLAIVGFLTIDRYDEKLSLVSNILTAKHTFYEQYNGKSETEFQGYAVPTEDWRIISLPYRWVLLVATIMLCLGLYLRPKNGN